MKKYKESGHRRAGRLNLGKPHIMWCGYMKGWILALYSFVNTEIKSSDVDSAVSFISKMNGRGE